MPRELEGGKIERVARILGLEDTEEQAVCSKHNTAPDQYC